MTEKMEPVSSSVSLAFYHFFVFLHYIVLMGTTDQNRDEIIEGAIKGGAIGAALGAILTGKTQTTLVASLVGAAIGASIQAQKEAKEHNMPVLVEENGYLVKLFPNGEKQRIRKLERTEVKIPATFTID